MNYRTMGRTGMEVSELGFGGAEIGYRNSSLKDVETLLYGALDTGINVIDTCAGYGDSEELIGRALGSRRNDIFLFTKCGRDWSREALERDIDNSLRRLRTDHLDLLQLWTAPEEILRRGEVFEVIERAKEAGKTRFVGYSGDHAKARFALQSGRIDVLQTSLSIADQEAIEFTLPTAIEQGVGVIAKRPLANAAWLTNKPGDYSGYGGEYRHRLESLAYDFLDKTPEESAAIALRFTLSVEGVHTAIVGTSNPNRPRLNAEILQAGPLDSALFESIRLRWRDVAQPDWVGQT